MWQIEDESADWIQACRSKIGHGATGAYPRCKSNQAKIGVGEVGLACNIVWYVVLRYVEARVTGIEVWNIEQSLYQIAWVGAISGQSTNIIGNLLCVRDVCLSCDLVKSFGPQNVEASPRSKTTHSLL